MNRVKRRNSVQSVQSQVVFALPFIAVLYNDGLNARGIVPIGRTAVSKTDGWGFESLCPCHYSNSPIKKGLQCNLVLHAMGK